MKKFLILLPTLSLFLMAASCDEARMEQTRKTDQLIQESNRQIGMPAIVNFQERRMMKDLYEKRDAKIATHSYIVNQMRGCLVYLGASIGFGLPYATQFTSPTEYTTGRLQPEPNGLYMPSDAHGTWIMLLNPDTKQADPVYIEPDVLVSSFRLINQECKQ